MIRYLLSKKLILTISFLVGFFLLSFSQTTIKGKVTEAENGEPIIGASVFIEGTTVGTITDFDGMFTFNSNLEGKRNLLISYIGYKTVSMEIDLATEEHDLNVSLEASSTALDAIVVTGTFGTRTQKESPLSMTYINAKQLSRLSSSSQADILRTVPGITAEGGGGEVASNVFVRGMPSGGQYQFTPLQVDGMPVLSTFGLNSSAHDVYFRNDIGVRNLEFVRGGASTLFGAGSVAGIINYSSITGSHNPKGAVQMEWAEGGRAKVDFLTTGPINENTFYAFSGFYRYDEGPLNTGLPTKGTQLRGNIKKLLNDGTGSLKISGQFIDDKVQFYLPFPLDNDNGTYKRPKGNDGETVYTTLTRQAADLGFMTPAGYYQSSIGDGVATKGGYLQLDFEQTFDNDWKLTAKAKYANYKHKFNLFLDGDGIHNHPEEQDAYLTDRSIPDVGAGAIFTYADTDEVLGAGDLLFENRILDRDRPLQEMVSEVNITKIVELGGLTHNFTLGTFLSHSGAKDINWIFNFLGDFRNQPRLVNLSYDDGTGTILDHSKNGLITTTAQQTNNKYFTSSKEAFYFADEIKGDRFNIDFGVRYEMTQGETNAEDVGARVDGSNGKWTRARVTAADFAVALAGLYKLNDETSLYANGSRGYFFPQLRSVQVTDGIVESYEPENVVQGELGAKISTKKLGATAALFYIDLSNRRNIDQINDGNGNVIEVITKEGSNSFGVELTWDYTIIENLKIYGGLTYQKHEVTKNEDNPDMEGKWLRRQPQVMGMLGILYDNNAIDINLSGNYVGKRYANSDNSVELDPYSLLRLDAGYTLGLGGKGQSLRLGVSVFNLADSEGITEGSPRQGNSQIADGQYFVGRPILPRRIFVKAAFNF